MTSWYESLNIPPSMVAVFDQAEAETGARLKMLVDQCRGRDADLPLSARAYIYYNTVMSSGDIIGSFTIMCYVTALAIEKLAASPELLEEKEFEL